jgi:NitT/TauT family transport system permease protein
MNIREEYEVTLEPFTQEDLARDIPLAQRIWQLSWVRKEWHIGVPLCSL